MTKELTSKQRAEARYKAEERKARAKAFDHVEKSPGVGPTKIKDVMTGNPVKSLKVVADLSDGNAAVMLGENANYAEILIKFDDGSKHHTMVDKGIVNKLSLEDLETIYSADIKQMMADADAEKIVIDWSLWADRTPISYERLR